MNPARILHQIGGAPQLKGFQLLHRRCRICGLETERASRFNVWLLPTATDWATWNGPSDEPGGWICEPCAWVRSGKPAKPPKMGSGLYPTSLRLLSHLWDEQGGWRWYTKGQKRELRDDLLSILALPPGKRWFAAIPDSGQKHTVVYAQINVSGFGDPVVAFETERVRLGLIPDWRCFSVAQQAYHAGWSKDEVLRCAPSVGRWKSDATGTRRRLQALRPFQDTSELALAVWLAQRPKKET